MEKTEGEDDFAPPPLPPSTAVAPPPGPPPLLSEAQLLHLAQQGWLSLSLPESLSHCVEDVLRSSSAFFDTPATNEGGGPAGSVKARLYPAKQGTEFGYYEVAGEKEYVTFRCRVHTSPSRSGEPEMPEVSGTTTTTTADTTTVALEDNAARAWRESGLLLFRILGDIARQSDLDLSIWDDILDGTLTMPETQHKMTYTLMRLFRYLPATGFAEEHTDLGLLTLCIGDQPGLQVLDLVGSSLEMPPLWVDAASGTRCATVLVGQTLRALSGGMVNAGVHRVVGSADGRMSVVFALRHSPRHTVDLGLFGGEGKVDPRELWKEFEVGKVNINTVKETRDAQRAKLAAAARAGGENDSDHDHDDHRNNSNQDLTTGQG